MDELKIFVLIRPENMLFYGEIYTAGIKFTLPAVVTVLTNLHLWGGVGGVIRHLLGKPLFGNVLVLYGYCPNSFRPPPSVKQANVGKSCIECEAAFQLFQVLNMKI